MPISDDLAPFMRPIAHRGLHNASQGRIENTGGAFTAAMAKDYAIECDLRPLGDGTPMVFHDASVERLVDARGALIDMTLNDMKKLRYKNVDEPILGFADLLALVAGRVPLMVEVKNEWQQPDMAFLGKIAALAKAYQGPIVLKSFDPALMAAIKPLAPDIPRGIVTGDYLSGGWWHGELSVIRRFALSQLLSSRGVSPSFISYNVKDLPAMAPRLARQWFKLPIFTWTVSSPKERATARKWADAPIFEGFEP